MYISHKSNVLQTVHETEWTIYAVTVNSWLGRLHGERTLNLKRGDAF
jgi:hypothetical protein